MEIRQKTGFNQRNNEKIAEITNFPSEIIKILTKYTKNILLKKEN